MFLEITRFCHFLSRCVIAFFFLCCAAAIFETYFCLHYYLYVEYSLRHFFIHYWIHIKPTAIEITFQLSHIWHNIVNIVSILHTSISQMFSDTNIHMKFKMCVNKMNVFTYVWFHNNKFLKLKFNKAHRSALVGKQIIFISLSGSLPLLPSNSATQHAVLNVTRIVVYGVS